MKMKRWLIRICSCLSLLFIMACTEDVVLDMPEGLKRPVVNGKITNEFKQHEIILSYTTEIYSTEKEMIPNAKVYVSSGNDTVYFYENPKKPGHYLSDSVSFAKNRRYRLEVRVPENTLYNYELRIHGDSRMQNNIDHIDSLALLPYRNANGIPFVDEKAAICVCPYFQALSNKDIVYEVELYLNGSRFKNRPSELYKLFPMSGYAGQYFNGPEMLGGKNEVAVGIMNKVYMHDGYKVKVKLCSIGKDYMYFLMEQKLSIGSNPVMAAFSAPYTNITSNCEAVGWFSAVSVVEAEAEYHEF